MWNRTSARKTPEQVFTPRAADVNDNMYVPRPDHEKHLRAALRGSQHILVHGESGSGKSWLYKRVLTADDIPFEVVNLANASSFGSIRLAFTDAVERTGASRKTGYTETKEAAVEAIVASGRLTHEGQYVVGEKEPLERCMQVLRGRANNKNAFIVLENLETVHDNDHLMAELGDVIILLDDQRYAQYGVKFIIVGVPADVREYFRKTPHRQTVANRLCEIPEVARLTKGQCRDLVHRGFRDELGYTPADDLLRNISDHVSFVTDGVPQRLHEYCLGLARLAEDNNSCLSLDLLESADWEFLSSGLWDDYETVFALMNDRDTKIGRKNQVLFALGRTNEERFTTSAIEAVVRQEFPKTTEGLKLNVSAIMKELSSAMHPIIRKTPKGDAFAFADPRYRMCIRAMLQKDASREKVRALNLGSI